MQRNNRAEAARLGTFGKTLAAVALSALLAGCQSTSQNVSGMRVVELDPNTRGPVAGVGIEGQDIVSMTDRMLRDMLANPVLSAAARPPQVIVDGEFFENESSQRLNKNAITDRLRVGLNRYSEGRMVFVGRHYASMVTQERDLKRQGIVDQATTGLTKAQAGADYRLGGRISSVDSRSPANGMVQRYNQIVFEMVDLERGTIVWSGIYEFARAAQDDIVYR
jgi:PBP1b-binding outer membrane lipoprotein LpoB